MGVVIPAFNAASTIAESIQSVLEQDLSPERVIVVNDGSTDGTSSVLKRFYGCLESVTQPNRGPSAARNTGWRQLGTDTVVFLDADDLLLPGALTYRHMLLETTSAAWAYTDGVLLGVDEEYRSFCSVFPVEDKRRYGRIFPSLLCRNFISTSGTIVRRRILEEIGGFDETITFMEDWDLWLRLAARFPVAFGPEPSFLQRCQAGSLSSDRNAMNRARYHVLVKTHGLFRQDVMRSGPAARRSVADAYNALGYARAARRQWRECQGYLGASLRIWPWQGRAWRVFLRCMIRRRPGRSPSDGDG